MSISHKQCKYFYIAVVTLLGSLLYYYSNGSVVGDAPVDIKPITTISYILIGMGAIPLVYEFWNLGKSTCSGDEPGMTVKTQRGRH
jgi:hypothetical protein